MLHFEFGQDRLAEEHALKSFELGQGAIEVAFEAPVVVEQTIMGRGRTRKSSLPLSRVRASAQLEVTAGLPTLARVSVSHGELFLDRFFVSLYEFSFCLNGESAGIVEIGLQWRSRDSTPNPP